MRDLGKIREHTPVVLSQAVFRGLIATAVLLACSSFFLGYRLGRIHSEAGAVVAAPAAPSPRAGLAERLMAAQEEERVHAFLYAVPRIVEV